MHAAQILIVGGKDIEQAFPRIHANLNTTAQLSFIKISEHENDPLPTLFKKIEPFIQNSSLVFYSYGRDSLLSNKSLDECKKLFWELSAHMRISGKGKKLFATALPVFSQGSLEDNILKFNQSATELANANGSTILDLYEYVYLRKTDMLDDKGNGLSMVGAELLGDVISAAILDLLKEGANVSLPFVATLGDSIQGGYNVSLRNHLRGIANVIGGPTGFNRENDWETIIKTAVLNKEREQQMPFSVIQFNWGLHALKYIQTDGTLATPQTGTQCVSPEKYGAELEKLVLTLKKTKAKLVFATTTPLKATVPWGIPEDVEKYNKIALEVMRKQEISVNDLFSFAKSLASDAQTDGCHFTLENSKRIAEEIAKFILPLLKP